MQFHGSILHPVTALGGGEKKKTDPRARKVSICQLSRGTLFKTQARKENLFIFKDLEVI